MLKLRRSGFLGIFIVLVLYSISSNIKSSATLPSMFEIVTSAKKILSSFVFYENLFYTIKIVLVGVAISFLVGNAISVLCSMSEILHDLIMPIINLIKNIPSVSLFPLFIILIGTNDWSRIAIIIWNSMYAIVSSTTFGFASVDKEIVEASINYGANKIQLYRYIKIPLATINMLEGLKISISNGFIAIVVAEMLGADKGLGYMILWSNNAFEYADMYFYILVIAFIGFSINVIIEHLIKKTKRRLFYESKKID